MFLPYWKSLGYFRPSCRAHCSWSQLLAGFLIWKQVLSCSQPCWGWPFHAIAGLILARLFDPHQCMCFPGGDAYRAMFPVLGTWTCRHFSQFLPRLCCSATKDYHQPVHKDMADESNWVKSLTRILSLHDPLQNQYWGCQSPGSSFMGCIVPWAVLSPGLYADRLQECLAHLKEVIENAFGFLWRYSGKLLLPFQVGHSGCTAEFKVWRKGWRSPFSRVLTVSASRSAGLKDQAPLRKDKHGFDPSLC